ncbi:DUF4837 family protein [Marinilabiliaceae bacterium ANBcel2]|nr:DUF4837 family protein [Marinilabiliaceae bacterium ANBcel2]
MRSLIVIFSLFFIYLISGCKESESSKPSIQGAKGEVLVVIDNEWRNGSEGERVREVLFQPMLGLPQAESIFTPSFVPHQRFTGAMRTYRNIFFVRIGEDAQDDHVRYYRTTTWAKGQKMVVLEASDSDNFFELLNEHEDRILGFFLAAERERSLSVYKRNRNHKMINEIESKFNVNMVVPDEFTRNQGSDNFSWMSKEASRFSQGLMVYDFEYFGDYEDITREFLLDKRDSALQRNVPGPSPGSYMATERTVETTFSRMTINEHQAFELRGLWKVEGDLMGGPFVLCAHFDEENSRIIMTDGYVYFPDEPKKRNLVWEVESLFYSVEFSQK